MKPRARLGSLRAGLPAALLVAMGALVDGSCVPDGPHRDSVVLIVVDTLRADAIGVYGSRRPTSPEIDAWAAGGAVFEHAYSVSPWTLTTFGTLLMGELPSTHLAGTFQKAKDGATSPKKKFRRLARELPSLAERLSEAGLATGAVISNSFLSPQFGIDRGFDEYDFRRSTKKRIRRADRAVDRALEWIDERRGSTFFLILHLMDPHITYDPPEFTRGRFSESVPKTGNPRRTGLPALRRLLRKGKRPDMAYLRALYDEEVAFVDAQLGRFLAALDRQGQGQPPLVILTSDHGEEFFDHDGFEHGHTMYDELLHVPLVVRGSGVVPGRVATPVSLVDLYPTVLEWAGVEVRAGLPGRSLGPMLRGDVLAPRPLLAEAPLYGPPRSAIIHWPFKLVRTGRRGPSRHTELFHLGDDPAERHNLADREPELTRRLETTLTAVLGAAQGETRGNEADLDPQLLEELRSLGYVQ